MECDGQGGRSRSWTRLQPRWDGSRGVRGRRTRREAEGLARECRLGCGSDETVEPSIFDRCESVSQAPTPIGEQELVCPPAPVARCRDRFFVALPLFEHDFVASTDDGRPRDERLPRPASARTHDFFFSALDALNSDSGSLSSLAPFVPLAPLVSFARRGVDPPPHARPRRRRPRH